MKRLIVVCLGSLLPLLTSVSDVQAQASESVLRCAFGEFGLNATVRNPNVAEVGIISGPGHYNEGNSVQTVYVQHENRTSGVAKLSFRSKGIQYDVFSYRYLDDNGIHYVSSAAITDVKTHRSAGSYLNDIARTGEFDTDRGAATMVVMASITRLGKSKSGYSWGKNLRCYAIEGERDS